MSQPRVGHRSTAWGLSTFPGHQHTPHTHFSVPHTHISAYPTHTLALSKPTPPRTPSPLPPPFSKHPPLPPHIHTPPPPTLRLPFLRPSPSTTPGPYPLALLMIRVPYLGKLSYCGRLHASAWHWLATARRSRAAHQALWGSMAVAGWLLLLGDSACPPVAMRQLECTRLDSCLVKQMW